MSEVNSTPLYKDSNLYISSAPVDVEIPSPNTSPILTKFKRVEPANTLKLTDAKIHQILLGFLSVISFSISFVAISTASVISTLFIAIPSLLISGALIWKIYSLKDYQDPKQLAQFRKDAKLEPFMTTISKHGLPNMIRFEIPAKEDFQILYCQHIANLGFKEGINFYEKITKIVEQLTFRNPFIIPTPSDFRHQFTEETKNLNALEIFTNYDIKKLIEYKIISEKQLENLEKLNKSPNNSDSKNPNDYARIEREFYEEAK